MNSAMIENWNSVVSNDDNIIHNGDFQFKNRGDYFLNQLNGKKILVRGNHDSEETCNLPWDGIFDILEFEYGGYDIVMCHYPLEMWNNNLEGSIHLYGHTHDKHVPHKQNRFNICVENTNYTPLNMDQILTKVEKNIELIRLSGPING